MALLWYHIHRKNRVCLAWWGILAPWTTLTASLVLKCLKSGTHMWAIPPVSSLNEACLPQENRHFDWYTTMTSMKKNYFSVVFYMDDYSFLPFNSWNTCVAVVVSVAAARMCGSPSGIWSKMRRCCGRSEDWIVANQTGSLPPPLPPLSLSLFQISAQL